MKRVRKLSDIVAYCEDRDLDLDQVVVDRKAIRIVVPGDEEEPVLDEDED